MKHRQLAKLIPSQRHCLQVRTGLESFFSSMQQLGSNRRCYCSHKALWSSFLSGFSASVIAKVYTEKYFTVCREDRKISLQSITSVLKATAWGSHWPPNSISNFPLYLNNSSAALALCCSHKETTCPYTASARQKDSRSLNSFFFFFFFCKKDNIVKSCINI